MQAPFSSSLDNNNTTRNKTSLHYSSACPSYPFHLYLFYIYPPQSLSLTHTTVFTVSTLITVFTIQKVCKNVIDFWISVHVDVRLFHL